MGSVGQGSFWVQFVYAGELALGFVFGASAVAKLRNPARFVQVVIGYDIFSERVSRAAGPLLIASETVLTLALIFGSVPTISLGASAALLCLFLVATLITLRRGRSIACGCFGEAEEQVSATTVRRVGFLLAGAVTGLIVSLAAGSAGGNSSATVEGGTQHVFISYATSVGLALAFVLMGIWLLNLKIALTLLVACLPEGKEH